MMGKILCISAAFYTAASSASALAQSADPETQLSQWCEKLKRNTGDKNALEGLKVSPRLGAQKALADQIVDQYSLIAESYGMPRSCDTIRQVDYGPNFVSYYIVVSHRDMASFWDFNFFNTASGWQLVGFNFNSDLKPFAEKLNGSEPEIKLTEGP